VVLVQGADGPKKALIAVSLAAILVVFAAVLIAGCGAPAAGDEGQTCVQCGSHEVIPIVYGLPDAELLEQAEAGEIWLGGCVVEEDSPVWHCSDCGHEWGRFSDTSPQV
jgi:hypothetical protein